MYRAPYTAKPHTMIAYIRHDSSHQCASANFYAAMDGLRQMGWELRPFQKLDEIEDSDPEHLLVGYIDEVQKRVQRLGFPRPPEMNYPDEVQPFLGRKLWRSTINTIANNPDSWGIFVKPIYASKLFTGVVVRSTRDLVGCGMQDRDTEVWCSEVVNFVAEWRCYVRYGEILDVRRYKGGWQYAFDPKVIEAAVAAYASAPAGYGIDFGLTDKGETLLVEVNDGYALGSYGLQPLSYAKLLSARWAQLTGTKDWCLF